MNQALAPFFPEKSLEAIKIMRKEVKHQKIAEPLPSLETSQSDLVIERAEESSENQELNIRTYIHSLPDIDGINVKPLNEMCNIMYLDDQTIKVKERLDQQRYRDGFNSRSTCQSEQERENLLSKIYYDL
ncbi:hypothetical protein GWI33_015943 [Rhynchophorus ferrugineus]|uniref:Uncharacterized protein n=1 Tax=Rhynchophorus ferrugineus TaxID=354439 RepID=A0A834IC65_RHYFE|nr:hypothetical protein GWI33_015943 [Rhynchophorus ferrugineus]